MDNKRWYSRFGTIFWWTFALLPLIIALIYFIGYHLTFNSGISTADELIKYHSDSNGDFLNYLWNICNNDEIGISLWSQFQVPYIGTMYDNLFQVLNINDYSTLAILFGWMTSVAFYHVLFDFSVWIFNWIHSLFDRWGCFK